MHYHRCILFVLALTIQILVLNHAAFAADTNDTDSLFVVKEIILVGNKITKDRIVFRELTFQKGDTLTDHRRSFSRSEENLMNTSLFLKVNITWLWENNELKVFILLSERWYIFPVPIFELADRNFNEWLKQKDFSRVSYGAHLYWNNFRGRNEKVRLSVRLGYTQRISLLYEIPFINAGQRSGLTFSGLYSRNREVGARTFEDDLQFLKLEERYAIKEKGLSVKYTYRHNLYTTHNLEGAYRYSTIDDSVKNVNADYFNDSRTTEKFFTLRYFFRIDHRDLKVYPLKGTYFDAEIVKTGFPFLNDDVDMLYATASYHKFLPLSNKFYLGTGVKGKLSDKNFQPYYNMRALGYGKDFVRGYEYYVADGQNFILAKANVKYELLSKRTLDASIIPIKKFASIPYAFYLNVFTDGAYTHDRQFADQNKNELPGTWLFGYGAGLDMVTYYDVVFRVEYSFNKFGESGIFLHFTASI